MKILSTKWQPFCPWRDELISWCLIRYWTPRQMLGFSWELYQRCDLVQKSTDYHVSQHSPWQWHQHTRLALINPLHYTATLMMQRKFANIPSVAYLNKKMQLYRYCRSHCGDKMVLRLSYLQSATFYAGQMVCLHWNRLFSKTAPKM